MCLGACGDRPFGEDFIENREVWACAVFRFGIFAVGGVAGRVRRETRKGVDVDPARSGWSARQYRSTALHRMGTIHCVAGIMACLHQKPFLPWPSPIFATVRMLPDLPMIRRQ